MTTRAGLRDDVIRERLADEAQWPDATLDAWINDAIRDYSIHFRRRVTATITAVADQVEYSLSGYTGICSILSVEWPKDEDPREYLTRRSETDPRGFWGGSWYDVRGTVAPEMLVIAQEPGEGEDIGLEYEADYSVPTADDDVLTVLDRHLEGLALFVWWKAAREAAIVVGRRERGGGAPSASLISALGLFVKRTGREAYYDWLQEAKAGMSGRSAVVGWRDIGL